MNRQSAWGAAGIVAVAIASCAKPPANPEPEFSAERIKAHVTFLADDLLEGREAGTRGHQIAAQYIASQFALLGVSPGGSDGGYLETVNLHEATPTGPPPTFIVTTPRGRHVLDEGRTVLIRGPVAGGAVTLRAPLVFVGYGMKDATVGYDDYQGLDVRGKTVVALRGTPKGMDSEIGAYLQDEQRQVAAEHGAAAIVWVQTKASTEAVPWEQVLALSDDKQTTWVRKGGTVFDPSFGLKVMASVDPNRAAVLFEGGRMTLAQILEEADMPGGRPTGFALPASVEISAATATRQYSSPEVIGLIEGSDPNLKNEYVVLMGHADHIGLKAGDTGDRINNGALDNAAGIATLIEVARAFTGGPVGPRRSILVVANTAEEKGLLGAEAMAHEPPVPIDRVTAAIDLDMPMLLYDFTDVVAYGGTHSTLQGVIQKAGATMGVTLSPDPMPDQAIFVRSDHYAMVKVGVPAVMFATGMANGGAAAWAKFLTNTYHRPSDDVSQPIVWKAGARFAELNYRVVRELADADARAQWFAADYFGNLFAAKAPKAARPAAH